MRREGENSSDGERRMVIVGGVGCPIMDDSAVVEPEKEDSAVVELEVARNELEGDRTRAQGESRYGEVMRKKQNEGAVPTVPLVLGPLPLPTLTSTAATTTPILLPSTCISLIWWLRTSLLQMSYLTTVVALSGLALVSCVGGC
jgi:hypothetical protein